MKQLEPRNQCPDMQDGLQARIHDPLWLLARQWQTGEFKANDAGSPIGAQLQIENSLLSRYRPGLATVAAAPQDYSPAKTPLRTLVEREDISSLGRNNLRLAAQAGLHFSRLLNLRGMLKYADAFRNAFPLQPPSGAANNSADLETASYLMVMASRVIDGTNLYAKLLPSRQNNTIAALPNELPFSTILPADRAAVIQVFTEWMQWYDLLFGQPQAADAWVKDRMEYALSISSNTSRGELVLAAPENQDGRLDWYAFDVDAAQSLGATGAVSITTSSFIPSPVSFRGMPATRYWELEDGNVNLANIQAAPQELARALFVTFALEFGNDWFSVPVEMPVGSLSLVRSLVVTNSFGERFLLQHTTTVDGSTPVWRMFGLSLATATGGKAAAPRFSDAFFLPPVIGTALEGSPVEEVLLLRDETASLGWAVERTVESPSGRRLDRHELFEQLQQQNASATPSGSQSSASARLAYHLGTNVPDYWIPLLPEQAGQSVRLRRGALPASQPGGVLQPLGRILDPGHELVLQDVEVPREGARVTRSYNYARWTDGSTQRWVGRRKEPGRGEGSSGLQFDIISRS